MGTTTLTGLPWPEPGPKPYVHLDMRSLAEATDERLPVVCTSTTRPPHRVGRRIFETDTKVAYISDGTVWRPDVGAFGTAITTGTNAEVTVNHGLPYTPTVVVCQVLRNNSGSDTVALLAAVVVWSIGATSFTVRSYRRDTNALFSNNSVAFAWVAR